MGSVGETILLGGRVALSLAVVLALMWFIAKRLGGRAEQGRRVPITVLGRHSLGRRSGLAVVEVAGQVLLLGVSDTAITMLSQVTGAGDSTDDRVADGDAGDDGDAGRAAPPAPVRRGFDALLAARAANDWQPAAAQPNAIRPGPSALLDPATWARAWGSRHGAHRAGTP